MQFIFEPQKLEHAGGPFFNLLILHVIQSTNQQQKLHRAEYIVQFSQLWNVANNPFYGDGIFCYIHALYLDSSVETIV